ncbi:MAG: DUF4347 domain-containing protein [Acidobacteriota bacterium]|nr:MAG: DUF4347 domain-containing protein [Acidobacteriota bacterium]
MTARVADKTGQIRPWRVIRRASRHLLRLFGAVVQSAVAAASIANTAARPSHPVQSTEVTLTSLARAHRSSSASWVPSRRTPPPWRAAIETASILDDAHRIRELVFVDAAVPNLDGLLTDLSSRAAQDQPITIAVIDASRSGIEQISEVLAGDRDLEVVHLVSHATSGELKLGDTALRHDQLEKHAAELGRWRRALAPHADLLLYGCDLAAERRRRALVDEIARLTGADVAASVDKTGSRRLDGDWELEYRRGNVTSALAFSARARESWNGLLNTNLDQDGLTPTVETAIFMIPSGADPLGRPQDPNFDGVRGVAVIAPSSALPAISDDKTAIDGTTQTANIGNTNSLTLGAGGTVGVDALALGQVAGPEVEIRGSGGAFSGILIQGNDAIVRGVAVLGFGPDRS